jgi:uridine kinase
VGSARDDRRRLLAHVAGLVPEPSGDDCVLVAVDGVDGVGKTMFADELGQVLRRGQRDVIRVSVDDFHCRREIRHRRGKDSPDGFWLDSFDYSRLTADVLKPLGPGGSRRYRTAAHDLITDAQLSPPVRTAAPGAVVVLDGLFLHRDGLSHLWDLSIWLDAPFDVTAARMAARDGTSADPTHLSLTRYVEGQRRYFAACDPISRASVVIDNSVLERPRLMFS